MNFRTIGFGLAAATLSVGTMLAASPAEALDITPGSTLNLSAPFLGSVRRSENELDFRPNDGTTSADDAFVSVDTSTGSFLGSNIVSFLPPLPHILDLQLIPGSPNILTLNTPLPNFLTGVDIVQTAPFVTDQVAFDLTSFVYNTLTGDATLAGIFRTSTSSIAAIGSFSSELSSTNNLSSYSLSITAVPTPALLPGAIAMGVAALRKKRKQEADADLTPEPVEA